MTHPMYDWQYSQYHVTDPKPETMRLEAPHDASSSHSCSIFCSYLLCQTCVFVRTFTGQLGQTPNFSNPMVYHHHSPSTFQIFPVVDGHKFERNRSFCETNCSGLLLVLTSSLLLRTGARVIPGPIHYDTSVGSMTSNTLIQSGIQIWNDMDIDMDMIGYHNRSQLEYGGDVTYDIINQI